MVNFYNVLEPEMKTKVLILSVPELHYIPNMDEEVVICGSKFYTVAVSHTIEVSPSFTNDMNIFVADKDTYIMFNESTKNVVVEEVHFDAYEAEEE